MEQETITFHADIDFTLKERKALLEAAEDWYRFTKGKIIFNILFDFDKSDIDLPMNNNIILKVNHDFYFIREYDSENKSNVIGFCVLFKHITIYMVQDRITDITTFKVTFKHELGHALGLGHTDPVSVMQPYNLITEFTELDAIEFCKVYDCDLSELDYRHNDN